MLNKKTYLIFLSLIFCLTIFIAGVKIGNKGRTSLVQKEKEKGFSLGHTQAQFNRFVLAQVLYSADKNNEAAGTAYLDAIVDFAPSNLILIKQHIHKALVPVAISMHLDAYSVMGCKGKVVVSSPDKTMISAGEKEEGCYRSFLHAGISAGVMNGEAGDSAVKKIVTAIVAAVTTNDGPSEPSK